MALVSTNNSPFQPISIERVPRYPAYIYWLWRYPSYRLSTSSCWNENVCHEWSLSRVLHMMFRHFRANTFACYDTLTKSSGEQDSSSSRQQMRSAIVCGSSRLTDCVLSMMPHLLTVVFQRPFPVRRCRRSHGRLDLAGRCSNRSWYLSWIRDRIPQDKIPQHKKWTKSHNVKIGK